MVELALTSDGRENVSLPKFYCQRLFHEVSNHQQVSDAHM